jgi:membrane protein
MTKNKSITVFTHFVRMLREAFKELGKNDPLRMAGATAFFTTFALPPILIILIQTLGLIYNPQKISVLLFEKLATIIGISSVQQVVNTLVAVRKLAQNWFVTIAGFIFLLFVATTLFKVIKGSLNQVWKIKSVDKRKLTIRMRTRVQSIMVILITGVLFVLGLVAEAAQAYLGKYLNILSPVFAFYFNNALNYVLSIIIVTVWFAIVFRFLPDGRPSWKVALTGGFVTSILFNIGKVVLRWLLTYSNINTIYGASGSIVLLLLFVFYSSLILYYGAAFTKIWGSHHHAPIRPLPHAMHYQLAEAEEEV